MASPSTKSRHPMLKTLLALAVAAGVWLPNLHRCFEPAARPPGAARTLTATARKLAAGHIARWTDPRLRRRALERMQARNPEWDFMSRTYFVLALANMGLADPAYRRPACDIADAIIEQTLAIEREQGFEHFLLPYGRNRKTWVHQPGRSLFVDGEIALMLAARRLVAEKPEYRPRLSERVELIVGRMRRGPVRCAESYPDECWLFCNTVALAAVRTADALDGTDHAAFLSEWVATAKSRLIDPTTGLLISAFGVDGTPAASAAGPEGSSIWMACHMLQIVDPEFARDQYARARAALGRTALGFGYSREWPAAAGASVDIDSGPVIPVLGASPSASGLALIAATAFGDRPYAEALLTSLAFGGFPAEQNGTLRYEACNAVGEAVVLYGMVVGPMWQEVQRRMER